MTSVATPALGFPRPWAVRAGWSPGARDGIFGSMRYITRFLPALTLLIVPFTTCAATGSVAGAGAQTGAAATAASAPDVLWRKAVEMARAAKQWVPGVTVMRIDVMDDKGKVVDAFESRFRLAPDESGAPVLSVESSTRNGKDTTAKERDAQEKRNRDAAKSGKPAFDMGDNPFDPEVQASIETSPREGLTEVGGRSCVLYSFSLKKKDGSKAEGTAALERETGAPVEVRYTLTPLPRGAQSFTAVLHYGSGPMGGGLLVDVEMEGKGKILFITRAFRSDISLEQYWRREGA
jgi:hypothetical protein